MKLPAAAGPAPEHIETAISMADDVFIKQMHIPAAGTLVPQHSHAFDHTSLLAVGSMRVWADDVDLGVFTAPVPINIKAHTQHRMMTLVDGVTFYCIHNTARAGMVEVIEEGFLPPPPDLPEPDASGVVIAEEPWPVFWRDGQAAMAEHAAAVGAEYDVDAAAVAEMDEMGGVHVVTARSNGRIFGYLLTSIGRSLERKSVLIGNTTAFYASRAVPGAGLKMLRLTIAGLRHKGVHELLMRAGVRGDGERLAAVYRRLGAETMGELYRLNLRET